MANSQQQTLSHQSPTTFPKLDSAVVDPTSGQLTPTWYRFLLRLWQLLGGNNAPAIQQGVFLASADDGVAEATVYSADSGEVIVGGAPTIIATGSSPVTWTAPQSGCIVASSIITLSLARGGTSSASLLAGGSFFVQTGDVVSASWGAGTPSLVFFPFIFK